MRILLLSLVVVVAACPAPPAPSEGEGEEGEGEEGEGEEGEGEEGEGEGEEAGVFCDVSDRVGFVHVVSSFGSVFVDGAVFDKVPATQGPASLTAGDCSLFLPADCAGCAGDDVCQYDGSCGVAAVAVDGVVVTVNGVEFAVNEFGRIEGAVDAAADYDVDVDVPGEDGIALSAAMPAAFAEPFTVDDLSDDGLSPGGISGDWDATGDGASVSLFLKPNHHAPTGFGVCALDDADEHVETSAEVMQPLRRVTGWEGGTASRVRGRAVRTSIGCIEVSVQSDVLIFPG